MFLRQHFGFTLVIPVLILQVFMHTGRNIFDFSIEERASMMREVAEFQKKYPNSARMPKDRLNLIYCLLMAISVVIFYAVPKLVWCMIPITFRFDFSQIKTS